MHSALKLLLQGEDVFGVDDLNSYYEPQLKADRLAQLTIFRNFKFEKIDIADEQQLNCCFLKNNFSRVLHLAAQAGVRYSIENPQAYSRSNLVGFLNVLECCRISKVKHFVYASSSSVYGGNLKQPFSESDFVDCPVSLYAATKKSNELMAYSYSHLYKLPSTGLRFFTVYGPWGRPDMAYFLFAKAILNNSAIKIFNHGDMKRDFTYIDDVVNALILILFKPPSGEVPSVVPARIFNVGNNQPVQLLAFIETIEKALKVDAIKEFLPMQEGDVVATYADTSALSEWIGFEPSTKLAVGIEKFVSWYKSYYSK